jgi:tripartite-type tricarboxylate transporter receptor subunit TctC
MNTSMNRRQWAVATGGALLTGAAGAQDFPNKPIRIVVPQA